MTKTRAWAAQSATVPLAPFTIDRRDVNDHDVAISILYCGVCHSDLHTVRSEWGGTVYPCIPGHEIVGRVAAVGPQVTRFREGELVGVGCIVDSCRHCAECAAGYEQFCESGFTGTYNSKEQGTGANTYGGYTERIVVDENFVLRVTHDKKIWQRWRRSCVRGSRRILLFATGMWAPVRGLGSLVWAVWGIWE